MRPRLAVVLVVVLFAGCSLPNGGSQGPSSATASATPTPESSSPVSSVTPAPVPTTEHVMGQCSFEKYDAFGPRVEQMPPESRRDFENLTRDEQALFLGNESVDVGVWNTSVRYVEYRGYWYATGVVCP